MRLTLIALLAALALPAASDAAVATQISLAVPHGAQAGTQFTVGAALSPATGPVPAPTGTMTFTVYGPDDPSCTVPVVAASTVAVTGAGTRSGVLAAARPGAYRIVAAYSGDANYAGVISACDAPETTIQIGKRVEFLGQTLTPSTLSLGDTFTSTVTVPPGPGGVPLPTGTMDFAVFGPGQTGAGHAACEGEVATRTVPLVNGTASLDVTPTAPGTYWVSAQYPGDDYYFGGVAYCDRRSVTVSAAAPSPTPTVAPTVLPSMTPTPTGPVPVTASQLVELPSAGHCVKAGTLQVHFDQPKGVELAAATVRVGTGLARLVPTDHLPGALTVRGMWRGRRVQVTAAVLLADGRTLTRTRTYRRCRRHRR